MTEDTEQAEWRQLTTRSEHIGRVLTNFNFQPGEFTLFSDAPGQVTIVYADKELS